MLEDRALKADRYDKPTRERAEQVYNELSKADKTAVDRLAMQAAKEAAKETGLKLVEGKVNINFFRENFIIDSSTLTTIVENLPREQEISYAAMWVRQALQYELGKSISPDSSLVHEKPNQTIRTKAEKVYDILCDGDKTIVNTLAMQLAEEQAQKTGLKLVKEQVNTEFFRENVIIGLGNLNNVKDPNTENEINYAAKRAHEDLQYTAEELRPGKTPPAKPTKKSGSIISH